MLSIIPAVAARDSQTKSVSSNLYSQSASSHTETRKGYELNIVPSMSYITALIASIIFLIIKASTLETFIIMLMLG